MLIQKIKKLSPRASIALTTVAQFATKPVGYLRIILIAYLFGASAGMDSFYIAQGAISLIMGLALSIVQTAVMPNLMRLSAHDDIAARSFFAWIVRFVLAWGVIASVVLFFFPSQYIWLFASQLDEQRISFAAKMLIILLPMGYMQLLGALLNIWANYKKEYSLITLVSIPMSPVGLISLFILSPIIGFYAVAMSAMLVSVISTLICLYIFRDIPFRPQISVPRSVLKKTGKDALMCVGMLGAGIMYGVTDRWFAAGLEVGNVTAISYAAQVVGFAMSFTAVASQMHLTHSSRISHDPQIVGESLNKSLAICWTYMQPVAFAAAALSVPVIRVIFGYGAFDERAVFLTAPCLAIGIIVLPLMGWSSIMGNFGLATSRLKLILYISYISVSLNIILDWLFTPIWGAAGICAATSLNQATLGIYYMYRMAPRGTFSRQIPPIIPQIIFASFWSVILFLISDHTFLSLAAGAIFIVAHLFICEHFGWLSAVPENWRPKSMAQMIVSKITK